ncbi:GNAT family acetyltransferase [Pacificibacter maritimus]|uniref:GNAT family acetyltransferase n=1 Tax=Pacificibacter maritimus TaxID=762213 RepID=A0A3N4VB72_9RHOB|nr:GNAT family N-acetyltransferase [Pacificibacter maritimus]RPE71070.1 GNAT family acetyltransferase [Pacificibacter maritimus]
MKLRPLTQSDAKACAEVFYQAVHIGAQSHYTQEQRFAWAPSAMDIDLSAYITTGFSLGATRFGRLVGFFVMGDDGHIDFAYVLPNEMGKGTARALYEACEAEARAKGLEVIDTQASHLAKRFLEKRGWRVTAQQVIIRNGVGIENFRMEKDLSARDKT